MFISFEYMVRERMEEREREVRQLQLVRQVKQDMTEQLKHHGAPLFQGNKTDKQPKVSKN